MCLLVRNVEIRSRCVRARLCVCVCVCVCVCACVYVCSIHLCVYEVYDVLLIIDNENLLH